MTRTTMRPAVALLLLALLALVVYLPTLTIPLVEDDYPLLWQAIKPGAPAALADPVFRLRATSVWVMSALWPIGKTAPLAYHAASLALHIANVWLLYGMCAAWPRMRAAAFWTAAFFAVAEGHQEAVMWFAAVTELLQFLFGMAALLCWNRASQETQGTRRWGWEVGGVLLFGLALISKESAVAMLPLFLLTTDKSDWRRSLVRLLPYLVLAVLAVSSIVFAHSYFFRFSDGSFSLRAPFWITWPRSFGRVLWVWGLVAGAAILWAKDRAVRCSAAAALAWIGIGLVPYSFLTYSTAISSRQTYLASAGLAMLVGVALADWQGQVRRPWTAAVLVLVLAHNVGYVWFRKRPQFLERAAPTEQLIALARRTSGPIWVRCFPRNGYIAEEAVHLAAGYPPENLIWNQAEAERRHVVEVFCYPGRRE